MRLTVFSSTSLAFLVTLPLTIAANVTSNTIISTAATPGNNCTLHTTCTEDGYFKEGECEPTFCRCWEGSGTLESCEVPLIFDETISACNWPDQVESCRHTTAKFDCDTLCAGEDTGKKVGISCCFFQYCWCGDGESWLTECKPHGNLFCEEQQACVEPEHCQADDCCAATTTQGTTTSVTQFTTPTTLSTTAQPSPTSTTDKQTTVTTSSSATTTDEITRTTDNFNCETDCANYPDGNYGSCCGSTFCMCYAGVGYAGNCELGQGFCAVTAGCVDSCEEDTACCSSPTTTSGTSGSQSPGPTTSNPLNCSEICKGQSDGNSGDCCASHYCMCYGGAGFEGLCSVNQGFCPSLGVCTESCAENVECCFD